jgi:hypothetical protein
MDDFAKRTDRRFDAIDRRFDGLERRMEDGFNRVNDRIDALPQTIRRTLLQLGVGLIATVAIGFAGIVAIRL